MNFLGMGPMELVLILVLALIVFGPGKLPEIAGQVGKMVRDFRRTSAEMTSEFNRAFTLEVEERERTTAAEVKPAPAEGAGSASSSNNILPPPESLPSREGASETSSGRRMRSDDLLPPY